MQKYSGKSVLEGIAIGKIYLYQHKNHEISQVKTTDTEAEKRRLIAAVATAKQQLEALSEEAMQKTGKEQAAIFDAHKILLEDELYLTMTGQLIEEGFSAEYAVEKAREQLEAMFAAMDDVCMRERALDIKDISRRLISILEGENFSQIVMEEPVIVVADDLTPSETIRMDKSKVLAFVTIKGSAYSHAAILARSMNIPTLVAVKMKLTEDMHGKMAVVDGFLGEFWIQPQDKVLTEMIKRKEDWLESQEALNGLKGKENITGDGRKIDIFANIGKIEEAEEALLADAGGIGLFRSEFLYLGRGDFPTEEEQFQSYKAVLEKMNGRKVVIRTLDIGADKTETYFNLEKEENPALGYRAIRICLDRPEILKTQLRAIYRASVYGNAAVMFPMIVSVEEIKKIKKLTEEVKKELAGEEYLTGRVALGVMIETPAAAMLSDELAKEVDFFSIGTNDLTQYTLAADRQNPKLEAFYTGCHPAVLRLIELTVDNAHKAGILVGICGELAADTSMTQIFVDMGIDELSVSVSAILKVRKAVRELSAE